MMTKKECEKISYDIEYTPDRKQIRDIAIIYFIKSGEDKLSHIDIFENRFLINLKEHINIYENFSWLVEILKTTIMSRSSYNIPEIVEFSIEIFSPQAINKKELRIGSNAIISLDSIKDIPNFNK